MSNCPAMLSNTTTFDARTRKLPGHVRYKRYDMHGKIQLRSLYFNTNTDNLCLQKYPPNTFGMGWTFLITIILGKKSREFMIAIHNTFGSVILIHWKSRV